MKQSVFDELAAINVNEHKEQKDNLSYLSWTWAWSELKKRYPDATYKIIKNEDENKLPYFASPLGIMVYTELTIEGITHQMWLPVMDASNRAMKTEPYTYRAYNRKKGVWEEKRVEAANMFDINKTIMRCLTKNIAMFGLGIYIYAGEDLPETPDEPEAEPEKKPEPKKEPAKKATTAQKNKELVGTKPTPEKEPEKKTEPKEKKVSKLDANAQIASAKAYLATNDKARVYYLNALKKEDVNTFTNDDWVNIYDSLLQGGKVKETETENKEEK